MSLDVELRIPAGPVCPHCGHGQAGGTVFEANITHNLGGMAAEAGIYAAVWRPEENDIRTAAQLIPILEAGIAALHAMPNRFSQFNSPNGWGTYFQFVPWLEEYLAACRLHPTATVHASR